MYRFCRNGPRKGLFSYCTSTKPWCYTEDPDKRWEYCDIPMCNREHAAIFVSVFNIQKYRKVYDPMMLSVR